MWYEILPSFGIVAVALGLPHFAAYAIHYVGLGNGYTRRLVDHDQRMQYLRDLRLSGNPYKVKGLEAIPDE